VLPGGEANETRSQGDELKIGAAVQDARYALGLWVLDDSLRCITSDWQGKRFHRRRRTLSSTSCRPFVPTIYTPAHCDSRHVYLSWMGGLPGVRN
jgi:hypothetical protein